MTQKTNPFSKVRKLGIAVFILTGSTLLFWMFAKYNYPGYLHWWVGLSGLILLAQGGWYLWKKDKIPGKLFASSLVICLLYLLCELGTWGAASVGLINAEKIYEPDCVGIPVVPLFNENAATFDPDLGYRWLPGTHRTMKIANGKIIFDQKISPNNIGFISHKNYFYEKEDSNTYRILVFGDSYTDAYFLRRNWVTTVENFMDSKGVDVELYSFAINGGGIESWHRTFMNEVLPNYDFDAVVFAIFGNDLDRDVFVMHHQRPYCYFDWMDEMPEDLEDLQSNYLEEMNASPVIISDYAMDYRKAKWKSNVGEMGLVSADLYLLNLLSNKIRISTALSKHSNQLEQMLVQYLGEPGEERAKMDWDKYVELHGDEKSKMLSDICMQSKAKGADIYFATIPELIGLTYNKEGRSTKLQEEVEMLAMHFEGQYFDGYNVLKNLPQEELDKCFLEYDGHWSQKGSDLFAGAFANWLEKNQASDSVSMSQVLK